ncbi:MAG: family 43 glycosylhydrolase [Lachnospiraceae bacterium]
MKYINPVVKGFHPDPSICRVGEDFYLVNSTFEFFPGVPIYHSKNLVNWELINYCLKTDVQLPLGECRPSHGIFAPTIRYHEGTFYMVTTNVAGGGHFYVKTDDIRGEWSEPIWVDEKGIDPSFLFDDGHVYFSTTALDEAGGHGIVTGEIDIETGEMIEKLRMISHGTGGTWVEGPHLYHVGEYYYLLTAEGGTSFSHMSCMLRGTSPYGPFEESPYGPLISHKDRMDTKIHALGHSDLVEDQNGNWFLVSLGIRTIQGAPLHHLGRETFLTQVVWTEDGWPVLANEGKVEFEMEADLPAESYKTVNDFRDDFMGDELGLQWNYVRNPKLTNYKLAQGLFIQGDENTLSDFQPNAVGVRQKEIQVVAQTKVCIGEIGSAGMSCFQNKEYHYDLYIEKTDEGNQVVVSLTMHGMTFVAETISVDFDEVAFKITGDDTQYSFYYEKDGSWQLITSARVAGICTEGMMYNTYTGTFCMLFAVSCNAKFEAFSLDYE